MCLFIRFSEQNAAESREDVTLTVTECYLERVTLTVLEVHRMQHATRTIGAGASPQSAPHAWNPAQLAAQREHWTWHPGREAIAEIEAAVAGCIAREWSILDITRADFPLPQFGKTLAAVRQQALWGTGVAVIRGLPIARWSVQEAAIAFWGLGTYLGRTLSQNAQGHVLGHVKNLGLEYADANTRGYQTSARLPFHTDSSDLVALMCLRTAREGGLSSVASSSRIYAEMQTRRPDLAKALMQPVCRSRWGELGDGQKPWFEVPVFNPFAGGVSTTYVRSAINKAQQLPGVPQLNDEQIEAMDMLDALAVDPEFHFDMTFAPGDMQIVNNHCLLHSRTQYVDHEDAAERRHLLRLWFACDDGPPFPQAMFDGFQGSSKNGRPNGIHVEGVPFVAPLDATLS
ncbi:MAG: hypothetical protein ACI9DC_000065 [Gammaproteobacteria bacterium]|jgi:hypothetical protein